jgi:hypothetical protein
MRVRHTGHKHLEKTIDAQCDARGKKPTELSTRLTYNQPPKVPFNIMGDGKPILRKGCGAVQLCEETIQAGLSYNGGHPFPSTGYAYAVLGNILYE